VRSVNASGLSASSWILDTARKPLGSEVTLGIGMPLQSHQHMRQSSAEQFSIEEIVSYLERAVLGQVIASFIVSIVVSENTRKRGRPRTIMA
jgi:hypothetical protein